MKGSTCRSCSQSETTTVKERSIKRLPLLLWVSKDNLRLMSGRRRRRSAVVLVGSMAGLVMVTVHAPRPSL